MLDSSEETQFQTSRLGLTLQLALISAPKVTELILCRMWLRGARSPGGVQRGRMHRHDG